MTPTLAPVLAWLRHTRRPIVLAIVVVGATCAFACFVNPIHDQEVAALGPETGGSPGPLHRPGQPCLVCHGGMGPASQVFSVAGTIYSVRPSAEPGVPPSGLQGAAVELVDSHDAGIGLGTNAAGNFYVSPGEYEPYWPLHASVSQGTSSATMIGHIGRNGSCAYCHVEPASASSPGAVYLYYDQSSEPDGGAP